MKANDRLRFIITTMDGVPLLKHDGTIMQYLDTASCRNNAKHNTFKSGIRHHSRGLTKQQYIAADTAYKNHGYIPLSTLGWAGD